MKTIIGIFALFFMFTFAANAQQKVTTQKKSEVKVADLPQAITSDLATQHEGWEAVKAFRVNAREGTSYQVIVQKDDQKMIFTYNEQGRLLNKEPYKEEKPQMKNQQQRSQAGQPEKN